MTKPADTYPPDPTRVKNGWYYEEPRGLSVCSPYDVIVIPWAKLLRSVERHKRIKAARKRGKG